MLKRLSKQHQLAQDAQIVAIEGRRKTLQNDFGWAPTKCQLEYQYRLTKIYPHGGENRTEKKKKRKYGATKTTRINNRRKYRGETKATIGANRRTEEGG